MTPLVLVALLLAPEESARVSEPAVVAAPETIDARVAMARSLLEAGRTRRSTVAVIVKAGASKEEAQAIVEVAAAQCGCVVTPSSPTVDVIGGVTAVLGTESEAHTKPFARVLVDWYLAGHTKALVVSAAGEFTGLPDAEVVSFQGADEFDAVQFELLMAYAPSPKLFASGYCSGGFASRLEGEVPAKTSAPLWSSCGLWFRDRSKHRGRLRVGLGADERLGWGWTMAAHVSGSVRLPIGGTKTGPTIFIDAILGLETPAGESQRVNVVTAGIGMGWGN